MMVSEKAASPSGAYTPKFFSATAIQDSSGSLPNHHSRRRRFRRRNRRRCSRVHRSPHQRKSRISVDPGWRTHVARRNLHGPLWQGLYEMRGGTAEANSGSIAYRKNALADLALSQGIEFFAFLRSLTADAFFTSAIGIKYLGYIGNTYLTEFIGCPPVPAIS